MGFLDGMIQQEALFEELAELKEKLRPEKVYNKAKKEKKCQRCGFCCHQRPCIPTPNEFIKVSRFLDMKPAKLFKKFYVIDYFAGIDAPTKHTDVKYMFPATTDQTTGTMLSSSETFTCKPCVFLNTKAMKCKIYKVRPKAAKEMRCWFKRGRNTLDAALLKWKNVAWEKKFGIDIEEYDDEDGEYDDW